MWQRLALVEYGVVVTLAVVAELKGLHRTAQYLLLLEIRRQRLSCLVLTAVDDEYTV